MKRYAQEQFFEGIGKSDQQKLAMAHVLVVGCGARGAHVAAMLAKSGIGHIHLVDRGLVNCESQWKQGLFANVTGCDGLPKVVATCNWLAENFSNVVADGSIDDVNRHNVERYIKQADIVIDGTEHFATRFLLNEACVKHNISWIFGSSLGTSGMFMSIIPGDTACLRCVFEQAPEEKSVQDGSISNVIIVAASQISEAIPILLDQKVIVNRSLVSIDFQAHDWKIDPVNRLEHPQACPVCTHRQFPYMDGKYGTYLTTVQGKQCILIHPPDERSIEIPEMRSRWESIGNVSETPYYAKLMYRDCQFILYPDGAAMICGTDNVGLARGIYRELVIDFLE